MVIAVSAWSFHQAIYNGKLRQVDVPDKAVDLGLGHVELLEMFLRPKPPGRLARLFSRMPAFATLTTLGAQTSQPDYSRPTLQELRSARLRAGVRLACWAIDTDLTLANAEARRAQMAHIATALQAARYLGGTLVRITTGGQVGDIPAIKRAADMLRNIAVVASTSGLKLAVENHFGLSEDPHVLADIIQTVNNPTVGVCLDFGNFAEGQFEEGIKLLAPLAIHVHAKSHNFADGEETQIDYRAALSALQAVGYDGTISIEYEGGGDAIEGIRQTQALIEKYC